MDGSVFVRAENRKLASDKQHPAADISSLAAMESKPSCGRPVWKLLPLPASIKTRKILFAQHVSHRELCQMVPNTTFYFFTIDYYYL